MICCFSKITCSKSVICKRAKYFHVLSKKTTLNKQCLTKFYFPTICFSLFFPLGPNHLSFCCLPIAHSNTCKRINSKIRYPGGNLSPRCYLTMIQYRAKYLWTYTPKETNKCLNANTKYTTVCFT